MEDWTNLTEILNNMRVKAENAYLNGEIATARHIATVALESCPDNFSIHDVAWCFAILIHCYKTETDYVFLKSQYQKQSAIFRFSNCESEYGVLISFLMKALTSPQTSQEMKSWCDTFLKMEEAQILNDVSTAILLETVIELLCFFRVEQWNEVGKHFVTMLAKRASYVSHELDQCLQRLSLQIIVTRGIETSDDQLSFLNSIEQELAKAWGVFYRSDFKAADNMIPKLSATVNFDSEYFLAVQGFINATKLSRAYASYAQGEKEKQEQDPWEFANYYRYQRFETERPLAAFLALRESNAKNVAHSMREKVLEGKSVVSKCWELYRMIPFIWADALKYWDLAGLLQAYKFQMEFAWTWAICERNAGSVADAIIMGILSLDSTSCKRTDVEQLIGILDLYGKPEEINRIYNFIFEESPLITWNLCVEWLFLLKDLLPDSQLNTCLSWTQEYRNCSKQIAISFNTKALHYLHPILQHYRLDKKESESLRFYFEKMFCSMPHDKEAFKIVLKYLSENDGEMCKELMRKMLNWEENKMCQGIIINSCIEAANWNLDLKEFCAELLEKRAKMTKCKEYQKFADYMYGKSNTPDMLKICELLRNTIEKITATGYDSTLLDPIYINIDGYDWSQVELQDFKEILDIVAPVLSGEKLIDTLNKTDLLSMFEKMFRMAYPDAKKMLADILLKNIDTLDVFCVSKETLYNRLMFIFCQIYDGLSLEQKHKICDLSCRGMLYYPQHLYYPTYIFLRASLEEANLNAYANTGLIQLRLAAHFNMTEKQRSMKEILHGIESALNVKEQLTTEVLEFILHISESGVKSIYCEDRCRVAKIMNKIASTKEQGAIQEILNLLMEDNRKSVRNEMV